MPMCEFNIVSKHNWSNLEMETVEELLNSNTWKMKNNKNIYTVIWGKNGTILPKGFSISLSQ